MCKERSVWCLLLGLLLLAWLGFHKPVRPALQGQDPVAWERFWVLKTHGRAQYDLVVMGDSRVYRGVSPRAMRAGLPGYRILNYGYSGGGLNPVMYAAAEQRVDPASRRKSIVLGISPRALTADTARNDQYQQELNRPPDYVFSHLYLAPALRFFQPFTPWEALAALGAVQPPGGQAGDYEEYYDDGWVASWKTPETPDSAVEKVRALLVRYPVQAQLVQALLEQTAAWKQQGYRVFAYRNPASPAMIAMEDQVGGFDQAEFARRFGAAGGEWLALDSRAYHSYDGNHLTKAAALQFSADLAAQIGAALAAGR